MPADTNESNGLNVIASGFVRIPKGGDKDSERSRINDQIQLGSGDSHQRGSISASSIMQEPEHMRALTHTRSHLHTDTPCFREGGSEAGSMEQTPAALIRHMTSELAI